MRSVSEVENSPVNRRRRTALNSVFGLLAWVLPIAVGFFTTPVLVEELGNEAYGIYAVVAGFLMYSFAFSIAKVAVKYVAEFRAGGQDEKISDIVSATLWLSLIVGSFGAIVLSLLARYVVSSVLLIENESAEVAVIALYIAGGTGLLAMISQVFQFTLQGLNRFGSFLMLTSASGILLGAGNVVIVKLGYGIDILLLWNLILNAMMGIAFFIAARSAFPPLRIKLRIGRGLFASAAKYGGSIILYQIFANILFIFERTWLTRKFGAEAMAFYAVPMLVGGYLHAVVGSVAMGLFPAINELLTNPERQIELYKKATKIIFAAVAFAVVTLILMGRAGLGVWINPAFSQNAYPLLLVHAVSFGIISMFTIVWQINEGYHAPLLNVAVTFTWAAVAISLMVLVPETWRGEGVALARLTGVVASIPLLFYTEKRFLGQVFWEFWLSNSARIVLALIPAGIVYYFAASFEAGWANLILALSLALVLYFSVLTFTGYLTKEERHEFLRLVPFFKS